MTQLALTQEDIDAFGTYKAPVQHAAVNADKNLLAIVALPAESDLVHIVGNEEKHATLLMLGENVSSEVVALARASLKEFMRTSSFRPFVETVSSVADMGSDGARAWMIDSDNGLRNIRERLLKQSAIRSLHDQVAQFPDYIPHVTIGYPEEGATSLTDFEEASATLVRRIKFDRLALWDGDDHVTICRFPDRRDYDDEVAMAHDAFFNDPELKAYLDSEGLELYHYGVKGQRWGVRNNVVGVTDLHPGGVGQEGLVRTYTLSKKKGTNKGTEKEQLGDEKQAAEAAWGVRTALIDRKTGPFSPTGPLTRINEAARTEFEKRPPTPERLAKYEHQIEGLLSAYAQKAAPKGATAKVVLTSTQMHLLVGSKEAVNDLGNAISKEPKPAIKHDAFEPGAHLVFDIVRDASGLIIGFDEGKAIEHSAEFDDYLAHYGVKGQRWGIRKDGSGGAGSKSEALKDFSGRAAGRFFGLNSLPKYKGKDLSKDKALYDDYMADAKAMFVQQMKRSAIRAGIVGAVVVLGPMVGGALATAGILGVSGTSSNRLVGPSGEMTVVSREEFSHAMEARYRVTFMTDAKGFISEVKFDELELKHDDDDDDDYLAHHGIKGQRWGIRRKRTSDGTVSGKGDKDDDDDSDSGSSGGSSGSSGGVHLSADAERLVKTVNKKSHEMSDREIKEANARATAIKQYNELFGSNPNKELADRVAQLKLEKEYGQLQAELHPTALQRANRLVKNATPLFGAITSAVATPTGKKLADYITKEISDAFAAGNSQAKARTEAKASAPKKTRFGRKKKSKESAPSYKPGPGVRVGPTPVYNVTNMGRPNSAPGDPFTPAIESRK